MRAVVLPGLDGTGRMLTGFVERLGKHCPTSVVAYPGDRALTYSELADFISEQLPVDEPFVLIAESFSGPAATLVASRRPVGLAGLAFVASFVRKPLRIPGWMGSAAFFLPLKAKPLLALARPVTFGHWTAGHGVGLTEAVAPVAYGVLAHRLRQILYADYRGELAGLDLPLLYLRPTGDRLVRASTVLEMARINPALAVRAIDGPHFILQTRTDEAADVLGDFVLGLRP